MLQILIKTHPNIRFAAICDMDGKILVQRNHEGVENIVPIEETKKHLKRGVNSWKERFELEGSAGKGMYAMAIYEKVKRITIPIGRENLLFLSIENKGSKYKGIENVLDLENIRSIIESTH